MLTNCFPCRRLNSYPRLFKENAIFLMTSYFAFDVTVFQPFTTAKYRPMNVFKTGSPLSVMCDTFPEHTLVKCKTTSGIHEIVI